MGRFLVLFGATLLLWHGLRSVVQQIGGEQARAKPQPRVPTDQPTPVTGKLVRCEQCGVHLPQERAILDEGHAYCGESCRAEATATPVH